MSKSTFTYVNLAGDRALVTDGGKRSTVLDVSDWNKAQRRLTLAAATEEFNAEVEEFYFRLTEAAEMVSGSVPRTRIQLVGSEAAMRDLLVRIKTEWPHVRIYYWLQPVLEAGYL